MSKKVLAGSWRYFFNEMDIRTQVNSNNELLINKQQELGAITGGLEDLISKTEELLRLEEQLRTLEAKLHEKVT